MCMYGGVIVSEQLPTFSTLIILIFLLGIMAFKSTIYYVYLQQYEY